MVFVKVDSPPFGESVVVIISIDLSVDDVAAMPALCPGIVIEDQPRRVSVVGEAGEVGEVAKTCKNTGVIYPLVN